MYPRYRTAGYDEMKYQWGFVDVLWAKEMEDGRVFKSTEGLDHALLTSMTACEARRSLGGLEVEWVRHRYTKTGIGTRLDGQDE